LSKADIAISNAANVHPSRHDATHGYLARSLVASGVKAA
jgi:hypothetical protein